MINFWLPQIYKLAIPRLWWQLSDAGSKTGWQYGSHWAKQWLKRTHKK